MFTVKRVHTDANKVQHVWYLTGFTPHNSGYGVPCWEQDYYAAQKFAIEMISEIKVVIAGWADPDAVDTLCYAVGEV